VRPSRRRFLKYTAAGIASAAAVSSFWIANSHHRVARWARRILVDARRTVLPAPLRPTPGEWSDNDLTVSWLGHATVLINFFGIRILTDPALGNCIGVDVGLGTVGPKRYIAPALRFGELPPIDLVLLSHAHMDHMDIGTLKRFPTATPVITARQTREILKGTRLKEITEMGWEDQQQLKLAEGRLQIEAFEVKHWGRRWPNDIDRAYDGYILRREGRAILFGGDTAHTSLFGDLKSRGPFDLAIMPIAAYQPWMRNHCTPEQAVDMANAAGATYIVPVHHQTFKLSDEPMNEPIERIQLALQREAERLALTQVGESFVCPAA